MQQAFVSKQCYQYRGVEHISLRLWILVEFYSISQWLITCIERAAKAPEL